MTTIVNSQSASLESSASTDIAVLTDLLGNIISDEGNPAYLAGALYEAKQALRRCRPG